MNLFRLTRLVVALISYHKRDYKARYRMIKRYFTTEKHLASFFKKNLNGLFEESFFSDLFIYYLQCDDVANLVSRLCYISREEELDNEEIIKLKKLIDLRIYCKDDFLYKKETFIYNLPTENSFFTDEFNKFCIDNYGISGIYFLYNSKKDIIYIGKSINLGSRIIQSSKEKNAKFIKIFTVKNRADLHILELYYINTYKPIFNTDCKEDEKLTININYDFKFENDFIEIFKEKELI